jgi:CDP-diacylglycerol--glycerol-3-phosphate 3-phosphatidyltransferase
VSSLTVALIAAATIVTICALLIGRQAPPTPLPDRSAYRARWAELHRLPPGRATGDPFTRGYTAAMHTLASGPARLGLHPDAVTVSGLWAGAFVAAAAGTRTGAAVAGIAVVTAALLDGLDGAVAVLTGRSSRFGEVLDGVVDRIVDGLWLVALVRAGGRAEWAVAAGAATGLLEYTRARGLLVTDRAGAITVGERPTRAVAAAIGLCGTAAWPSLPGATGGLVVTAGAATVGWLQLLVDLRRRTTV